MAHFPALVVPAAYMLVKYSLRWGFYMAVGGRQVREVRNPQKRRKLVEMARRYGLDEETFVRRAEMWRRWWPFLP